MKNGVIAGLVLMNLCLIYLSYLQKNPRPLREKTLNKGILELLHGREIEGDRLGTLYIFFHADGACACLEDWPNWVHMVEKYQGDLAVKRIFMGNDQQKFLDFSKGVGLNFPLYLDNGGRLAMKYNVPKHKVTKILVDPAENVIFMDSNQVSPRDQDYFMLRIDAHIQMMD